MIDQYLEKRNHAVIGYVMVTGVALWRSFSGIRGGSDFLQTLLVLGSFALFAAACWCYLRAKNRSGVWLLLLPLSLIAVLIYWKLEDRSADEADVACPACKAPNFPDQAICRVCKTSLHGATPIDH